MQLAKLAIIEGNIELISGLRSKLNAIALAILESISNDSPSVTTKKYFSTQGYISCRSKDE